MENTGPDPELNLRFSASICGLFLFLNSLTNRPLHQPPLAKPLIIRYQKLRARQARSLYF